MSTCAGEIRQPNSTKQPPVNGPCLPTLPFLAERIGAKVVSHGRYVAFQMAEVAIPRNLFGDILRLIAELRPPPDPVPA